MKPVNIRWTNPYGFRYMEWAAVIGMKVLKPEGLPSRPVFHVKYPDGFEDYIPVSDKTNYEIR